MTNVARDLRAALASDFALPYLPVAAVARAADGTSKVLLELDEGKAVETVLIPDGRRLTVCISSQAGCAMGCSFCATSRLGLQRQLTAAEIAGQVLAARRLSEQRQVTNIVFMGMGEPLANCDAVVEAIEILLAPWGMGFSGRRITVSTVGLLPQLQRLVRETPVNVAVSLNATSERVRSWIMPVNRQYPLERLMATCRALPIAQRRRITFEYVLLAGVNDAVADAAHLVRLLHGIRAKVNLIPFNPFPGSGFRSPSAAVVQRFQERLLAAGVSVSIRVGRGQDIQAACGQLAAR